MSFAYTPTVEQQVFFARYGDAPPPSVKVSLPWQMEMERRTIDKSRFPDFGPLWGTSTKHFGYQPGARVPEGLGQSEFQIAPRTERKNFTTPLGNQRIGIEAAAHTPAMGDFAPATYVKHLKR